MCVVCTVAGAASVGSCFTLSTIATSSIEEIATACPSSLRFFQLYIYRDRDVTWQLIARAEQAGFAAVMLTVDTPFLGRRRADNRNKFKMPPHLKLAHDIFSLLKCLTFTEVLFCVSNCVFSVFIVCFIVFILMLPCKKFW